MVDGGLVVAPPGWFPDPVGLGELRWWSGDEWTDHVAASPEMRPADVPRPGSLLPAVLPVVPLRGSFVAPQPETSAYVPFGGDRSGSPTAAGTSRAWMPSAPTRWNTGGAAGMSATSLIAVVSAIGMVFAITFSLWLALVIALLPLLWSVAAATRDRSTLGGFGYVRLPSRWWLLLSPLAYLIARTVYVRRESGHGSAPLWWYLAISVALGILSVAARFLLAWLVPTG